MPLSAAPEGASTERLGKAAVGRLDRALRKYVE